MFERFAIYYAPAVTDPLWQLSAGWLGRDALSGADAAAGAAGSDIPGLTRRRLDALSVDARRYGFHATIKPPMTLATGTDRASLDTALRGFAARQAPIPIGALGLRSLDGFTALMPALQSRVLTGFAARVVEDFDRFRAPLDPAEREKRLRAGLTDRQVALLDRYGYPYVMEQFQFHMTLTDRLDIASREDVMAAAHDWFAPVLGRPMLLDRLVLFHEPEPGAAFSRLGDFVLSGSN